MVLKKIIQQVVGEKITLIDSARPTALELKKILKGKKMLSNTQKAKYDLYVTDAPKRVYEIATILFEGKLPVKLQLTSL